MITSPPAGELPVMPIDGPDIHVSVRQVFGVDSDLEAPAYSQVSEHVPDIDDAYHFDHETTLAILAGFEDVFGLFGAGAGSGRNRNGDGHAPANDRDALAVMDLAHPVTLADIKARFKQLAKCLHPDVNGGDTKAENRLKRVIEAYRVLLGRRNS